MNDNADPRSIDPAGFHFSRIDSVMSKVVLPIRQRLQARGERLFLNLNYVAFLAQCTTMDFDYVHDDPAEYAELILATFLHLRNRYGIVPDALEIILEPDNVSAWNPVLVGKAMVSAAARLAEHGFRPAFIAPSTASMANAVSWSRELLRVPGVPDLISEIAYHRYGGVSMSNLRALAALAHEHGARTAMLEHIGSGADDLYADLTAGGASSWQQFTLAYPTSDNGAQYYRIVDARPVMGSRTRYLRQYFRYVRLGSQRIEAISDRDDVRTVAFLNRPGGVAVVVHAPRAGTIEVRGLPPGTYGASVTTEELTGSELPEQSSANGVLTVDAPARGILTVYRK